MDHISKLTSQASQKEQPTQDVNLSNKIMTNLWERLTHIYGHKFASAYGESAINGNNLTEAARTWSSGLRGLTGEHIANGLRECIACGESWPPTLPEFVKMCKGETLNGFGLTYTPECYRERKRERLLESDENKEAHENAYQSGMSGLKDILNK